MNTKNNRRFQETELAMETVLLKLMEHHSFEDITVRMICEKADVNRSTFYAHFQDIYDMLEKMEHHLHEKLMLEFQKMDHSRRQLFTSESFHYFLEHIKTHQSFYQVLLKTRTQFPIQEGYDQMFNIVVKPQCQKAGILSEEDMQYILIAFQAAFTNILRHWVDTGCHKSSDELAVIVEQSLPAVFRKTVV